MVADMQVIQSTKLSNVCYEIRGPVLEEAMRLEAAGHRILKLNTGNPATFGFECPRRSSRTCSATSATPTATATPRGCCPRGAR
ncbi:hypothetical protein SSPO_040650 [Streptomyces antimycoticus]|uniref:Aminotransferase class I/classII domain-containing protein n=1 Tax=Streptomyces antimycoticus TaxID=68175 RepID=A0A499V5D8_9ACTN|nr:hypothetical protein SSPO_040650 [Streptomyces antimycoticus]